MKTYKMLYTQENPKYLTNGPHMFNETLKCFFSHALVE